VSLIVSAFGQRVREERIKQGLSQEELAEKAGVHRTYIGMIERGEKNITLGNIEKIAIALEVSISHLLDESDDWIEGIRKFCKSYNIPLDFLPATLWEPKVIPMIRGKAFEFCVQAYLSEILPQNIWYVDKPVLNPQFGFHDSDVRIKHLPSGKVFSVECNLAKKGSYKYIAKEKMSELRVKCMRSRTLGEEMVKNLAPKYKIPEQALKVHNDQYLPSDFHLVVTSIGNAFYETDQDSSLFIWEPSEKGIEFLENLRKLFGSKNGIQSIQDFAFETMYIAKSKDIAINQESGVICTRRKCDNKSKCGFIPNYPVIQIPDGTIFPTNKWYPITESEKVFNSLCTD